MLHEGGLKDRVFVCILNIYKLIKGLVLGYRLSVWFYEQYLSGTKYRVSPEGVSLRDETYNLASHITLDP